MPAPNGAPTRESRDAFDPAAASSSRCFLIFLLLPIYWLVNMSFKTNHEIVTTMTLWPLSDDRALHASSPTRLVFRLYQLAEICRDQHRDPIRSRCRPPTRFRATVSSATSICSSGCCRAVGAGGGLRAAVLQPLLRDQPVRYAVGGGAGGIHLQRPAGGVDSGRLRLRRAARDR